MKQFIIISISLFFIYSMISCSGCGENAGEEIVDSTAEPMSSYDLPYADIDMVKKIFRRDSAVDISRLNIDSVIKGLNWRYENTGLQKLKVSGDTVYVTLRNNKYLSEEMGTTGAEEYIADVVANLTCISGIGYVNFIFPEGEHASPGVYGKDVLDDLKEVN